MEYKILNNGVKMPMLGVGVFKVSREDCERCVLDALEIGYRLIDTAQSYYNEEEVGSAIKKSGVPRDEIFLTTKVWIHNAGYERAYTSILESMEKLQVDYLDLCLIHQPFSDYYGTYRAMEDLYAEGKIRAIGISNFYVDRMIDISSFSRVVPAVNQIEIHPYHQRVDDKKWNDKYGVLLQAWAPFAQGVDDLFSLPALKAIAEKYGKTTAQVMLRWHLQRGIAVIPKSLHKERLKENFEVFDFKLSDEDMEAIAALNKNKSILLPHYDPERVEFFVKLAKERQKQ